MKKDNIMGFILLKKISLLFLLVSSAFAGRASKLVVSTEGAAIHDLGNESWEASHGEEMISDEVHGRLLKVKTNDYGRYDPSPSFVKPPFKLIPN